MVRAYMFKTEGGGSIYLGGRGSMYLGGGSMYSGTRSAGFDQIGCEIESDPMFFRVWRVRVVPCSPARMRVLFCLLCFFLFFAAFHACV